ncbi:T9SS type A sorting domain-containing protein [Panacibacter ginsenosidivorans]|uniref:T9SS type A sorting domain-containing protein n=1 Tax=Panacibacter ginsenosidivorans TaxID=1813871 RepID=A0A5B8V653_9BACT|nr:FG-GAP-like repeat-containing protein [Panacibacter ginsenosidivorans]QEC66910.1 T9SS type A sorting domain-containing protein [Panacibacter ginsenosidivorans]
MKITTQLVVVCLLSQATFAQPVNTTLSTPNSWIQKADFNGGLRNCAIGFSIGDKGYLGTGSVYGQPIIYYKDFWEFDPQTNVWTQKADFGGTARDRAVGFNIGDKGYVGTGYSPANGYLKDFWEYDPAANQWTRKSDLSGPGRYSAFSFSSGYKGYIGTGDIAAYTHSKDFWEYDQSSDTWTRKADFGGAARQYSAAFAIDGKGYAGTGYAEVRFNDFWEYNPTNDIWTQKANFPGSQRAAVVAFAIKNKGYIGTGSLYHFYPMNDFWEFDPVTDKWTQKADFSGKARDFAVGFSIGNKGYVGTGRSDDGAGNIIEDKDFWEYTPDAQTTAVPTITSFAPTSGPVGTTVTVTGTNFGANPADNIVYFGATKAVVTAASTTTLKVKVPVGATYQPVSVTVNGLTGSSAMPFVVTFKAIRGIDTVSFAPAINISMGSNPDQMALADIDGDGKSDMIVGSYGESALPQNAVAVFRNTSNTGAIAFAQKVELLKGSAQTYPVVTDFDGNGKTDLAVLDTRLEKLYLFSNKSTPGNISLIQQAEYTTGDFPYSIGTVDIDGDGKPDIVIPNLNGKNFSVFRNTSASGSISFAPKIDFQLTLKPISIAIGDLDKDGKTDIVIGYTDYNNYTISIFRNNSTPGLISFDPKIDLANNADGYTSGISIGDLDGDSKLDITISNFSNSASTLSLYRNTGSTGLISFAPKVSYATKGTGFQNNAINDLDGDSKPDIAGTNYWSGTTAIFKNKSIPGTLSLGKSVMYPAGSGPKATTIGDIDGDGKPDIIFLNLFSGTISILRNQVKPSLCQPPSSLTVDNLIYNTARLGWTLPDSSVNGFMIRYYPAGTNEIRERLATSTATHLILKNLQLNTTYKWKIRSVCSSDVSSWVKGPDFTTAASFALSSNAETITRSGVQGSEVVQIVPNPSNGNFTIQMQLPAKNVLTTLALYNSFGERIWQQQAGMLSGTVTKSIALDSKLSEGVYILRIERSDVRLMQKVVVNK